jgi:hypothetical protein
MADVKELEVRSTPINTKEFGEDNSSTDSGKLRAEMEGTRQDQHDMHVLGRQQELRVSCFRRLSTRQLADSKQRNFRFITILGFACTLMSSWETILT